MPASELFKSPKVETTKPKKSLILRLMSWPFRFLKELLGIDFSGSHSYSGNSTTYYRGHGAHDYRYPRAPGPTINDRDIYRLDPEKEFIRRLEVDGYMKATDGKGDPEPPCHCDHDER